MLSDFKLRRPPSRSGRRDSTSGRIYHSLQSLAVQRRDESVCECTLYSRGSELDLNSSESQTAAGYQCKWDAAVEGIERWHAHVNTKYSLLFCIVG